MSTSAPRVPGFTLERLLGRGGSGEVWSARVTESGDRVALKVLSRVSPDAATEAAVLETLDHPHLVRVIGMLSTPEASVLVLDLAEGGSLAQLLDARGRLPIGEVVTALSPIALALAHAHLNGVVHADVTPGNILFTAGGLPLLADLGLARITGDDDVRDVPRCTPEYVDPSVARGSVPTASSDVFMLAAVAVHALTGAPIWQGATSDEAFASAERADLRDLGGRLRAASVPDAVVAVLLRATDLDPMKRGTAASLGLDLRHAADPEPVDLTPNREAAARAAAELRPSRSARHAAAPPSQRGASQVFTRIAGSRPKPVLPVPRRQLPGAVALRRVASRVPRRASVAIAFVLAVLGGAGVAWAVVGGRSQAPAPAPLTSGVALPGLPTGGVEESLATEGETPSSSAARSSPPLEVSSAQAARLLTELDSLRQQAFARRIPLLLTGVYPTGPLLTADTKLLERLVPAGCGLDGVRTSYDHVKVASQTATTVILSANVALQTSYLVCNGKITATAPGTRAQLLRITLVWRGNGYLIGDIVRG